MKKYVSCILLILSIIKAQAQVLQGKIVDQVTGVGIPFVSVGVLGTNTATVSNDNGEFVLKIASLPAKLRFSHVSYLLAETNLTAIQEQFVVKLKPANISLNEVTIDPYLGRRIIKAALEKATASAFQNFYANAFYRQLTSINNSASQIYELFYDLKWNNKGVAGWLAKQSRFAEQRQMFSFSLDNQSYFTFSYSGYLFSDKGGKFIKLASLADYEISIDRYIEQADQKIAVISCKYKKARKKLYYVNSIYYVGMEDYNVYRLENSVFNLPITLNEARAKYPPIITTIATFNGIDKPIPVLESISTKISLSLDADGVGLNVNTSSLLTVFNVNENLKDQQFQVLNRKTKDKTVIESLKYDAAFWKNNPIVKQTKLEDSFIKLMESKSAFGTMINP